MSFYAQVYSEEQVAAMIRQSIETHRRHRYGRYAVIEKLSGEFIGDCGITIQDIDGEQEYEIGYRAQRGRHLLALADQLGFHYARLTELASLNTVLRFRPLGFAIVRG